MKPKVLVIVGPTASGKSDLAVTLGKRFKGEVISADSRQVYKNLDIGTGKITKKEMRGVPHHMLDLVSPKKSFTVAQFQKLGTKHVKEIIDRGHLPIICGGTGLYVDALVYNYSFPSVKPNPALRRKLEAYSIEKLSTELERLDPERAKTIDKKNPRRLIRALEIVIETGKPVPRLAIESPYEILKIGIRLPEKKLEERIKRRFYGWLIAGFLDEVKKLIRSGVSGKKFRELGLEYKYAYDFVKKNITKEEMTRASLTELKQYAKRQITWFKRDKAIRWVQSEAEAIRLVRAFL